MLKKYPNRRLYDTEKARYETLESIRSRVLEGGESVTMHNADCDITASVLLSLLARDVENRRPGAPTADELRQFMLAHQGKAPKSARGVR